MAGHEGLNASTSQVVVAHTGTQEPERRIHWAERPLTTGTRDVFLDQEEGVTEWTQGPGFVTILLAEEGGGGGLGASSN